MKFTFIGSGDSAGVPAWGCSCPACERALAQSEFSRSASCAQIEVNGNVILIDAGLSDFKERFRECSPSAVILTHYHGDHVMGLMEPRWGCGPTIPVFSPDDKEGFSDLYKHPGIFDFDNRVTPFESFVCADVTITPIPLTHAKLTYGYLFEHEEESIAYLTDNVGIPDESLCFLDGKNVDVVVIDSSFPPYFDDARNHNSLDMAVKLIERIKPNQSYLTHISHLFDEWEVANDLCQFGENLYVARDGLTINI